MKQHLRLIVAIIACVLLVVVAYFWVMAHMDSVFAYRSPLRNNPPIPAEPLGEVLTQRVVFVLVDALREDTSLKSEAMPFLNQLRQRGAWATMHSRPPSYSAPSYSVLMTGAWPDISDGPALNLDYEETPTWTQDNLFSSVHRAGGKTAVSAYYWFEKLIPQEAVNASFYTQGEDQAADREVVDAAIPWLKSGDYQLVFIHIDQVDYAGHHEGGPRDPRWDDAARRADELIREIATELDLDKDTLFVCSDHGQIDAGGHGGQDAVTLVEPWVIAGAGIKPGHYEDVKMVDVAPTLAAILGANLPASSQGRALTEMLDFSTDQVTKIERALVAQQSQLVDAYQQAIGYRVAPRTGSVNGEEIVSAYQAALEAARQSRLRRERLPRYILASLVLFLPLVYLFRKRGADLAWLLGGAVLYMIGFNLRYSLIDGRTYSLSSVESADGLIIYCAVTALIAMLISWLLIFFGVRAYRRTPRQASELTLGLVFLVIYLLFFPVMWSFAFNGATTTWTLPEFGSAFLALIALIQILLLAPLGLGLAGLAALISRFTR